MNRLKIACGTAALAMLALSGCGSSEPSGPPAEVAAPVKDVKGGTLTFVSYGGPFQENQGKAWLAPFTAANETTFNNDGPSDQAKIRAMVEGGKTTWDVVDGSPFFAREFCGKYVERLDLKQFDTAQFPKGTVNDCSVPAERYGLLFVYNTEKFGAKPPTKVADYFDTKAFPGKRGVVSDLSSGLLEAALLADGVAPGALYPLDVDRALGKFGAIRKDTIFATNNGQLSQLLTDKQADMGLIVTARAISTAKAGAPIAPVFDHTVSNVNALFIPKGSPNKDLATKFLAFATKPEQSARFSELSGTAPANTTAKPVYDAVTKKFDAFAEGRGTITQMDVEWWAQNFNATQQKFTIWLAG
ncbi:MAG: hypothetical protein JWN88_1991 [Frankiales bacterium]|nr:hypothetical protein [Frankiales bacterium]